MRSNLFPHSDGQCYGVTTLGERGQVVVPTQLRKNLHLKTGEKLLVFSRFGKLVVLIKAAEFESFLSAMLKHFGLGFMPRSFRRKLQTAKDKRAVIRQEITKLIKQ